MKGLYITIFYSFFDLARLLALSSEVSSLIVELRMREESCAKKNPTESNARMIVTQNDEQQQLVNSLARIAI